MNKFNVHTNTLGLARSFLAFGTFLTLCFNSFYVLFPEPHFNDVLKVGLHDIESISLFFLFKYEYIYIPYWISLIVLVLVMSGIYPRITCFLHAWITYSIFHVMLIIEGGDQISAILTLLLIPICIADNRKNHWHKQASAPKSYFWGYLSYTALYVIKFQIAILYLNAGVEKLKVEEWRQGTAVYYWFTHNVFGAPGWVSYLIKDLLSNPYFVTALGWGAIILEFFLFTANFLKQRYKYLLFFVAIFFHFMTVIIHGLPNFFLAMTGALILYLIPINRSIKENRLSIKKMLNRIFRRAGQGEKAPSLGMTHSQKNLIHERI